MKIYTYSTKKLLLIMTLLQLYDSYKLIKTELRNGKGEGGLNLNFFTEFFTWLVLW